jgi:hypothetical protein
MQSPDPKYLPKSKPNKKKRPVKKMEPAAFPELAKKPVPKIKGKDSPFGDKHVWAN